MRGRGAVAAGLGLAVGLGVAGSAGAAPRTVALDGWADQVAAFSGTTLVVAEAATVHVDPRVIAGSPPGATPFDYYRAETSRVRLNRARTRFTGAPRDAGLGAHQHRRHGTGDPLAPMPAGGLLDGAEQRPGGHARDLVLRSGGRRDRGGERRPDRCARDDRRHGGRRARAVPPGAAGRERRPGGRGPRGRGRGRTAVDVPVRTRARLAALAPGLLAWVDPAAPAVLARASVGDTGLGAIATTALPGPALRVWASRGLAVVAVSVGGGVRLIRVDPATGAASAVWRGPRAARLGGRRSRGGGRRAAGAGLPLGTPARRGSRAGAGGRGGRGRPARGPARARSRAGGARDGRAPEAGAVRRLAAALAALALLALLAGSAAAAPILSLQDDDLVNVRGPALDARLDALAATGTRVTRVDVLWREVAPTRPADARNPADPAYDWSRYDQIVRGLSARGISVILDFYLTPAWASHTGQGTAAPRAADGARFAGAIARRYSGSFPDPAGGSCRRCAASRSGTSPTCPGSGRPSAASARAGGAGLARRVRGAAGRRLPRDPRREPGRPGDRRGHGAGRELAHPLPGGRRRGRGQPRLHPPGGRRGAAHRRLEPAPLPARKSPSRPSSCHPGARCPRSSEQVDRLRPGRRSTSRRRGTTRPTTAFTATS